MQPEGIIVWLFCALNCHCIVKPFNRICDCLRGKQADIVLAPTAVESFPGDISCHLGEKLPFSEAGGLSRWAPRRTIKVNRHCSICYPIQTGLRRDSLMCMPSMPLESPYLTLMTEQGGRPTCLGITQSSTWWVQEPPPPSQAVTWPYSRTKSSLYLTGGLPTSLTYADLFGWFFCHTPPAEKLFMRRYISLPTAAIKRFRVNRRQLGSKESAWLSITYAT